MVGAKLGQGGVVGTGLGKFLPLDRGREALEDKVWSKLAHGSLRRRGMEVC